MAKCEKRLLAYTIQGQDVDLCLIGPNDGKRPDCDDCTAQKFSEITAALKEARRAETQQSTLAFSS